jgi:hypothetical protein
LYHLLSFEAAAQALGIEQGLAEVHNDAMSAVCPLPEDI